jgi:hypothetical protein
MWVLGNMPGCKPTEIFSINLRTHAPITGYSQPRPGQLGDVANELEHVEIAVPRTLVTWIRAQQDDPGFPAMLEGIQNRAVRQDLWIGAPPPDSAPTILVPPTCQELLVHDTHEGMFHLSNAKVYAFLLQSYAWPMMKRDVRAWLSDCPVCDFIKARQKHCTRPAFRPAHTSASSAMVHGLSGPRHGSHRRDRDLSPD